jgi:hypothetical protein
VTADDLDDAASKICKAVAAHRSAAR